MICPLHGEILKENLSYYIEKYKIWSSYKAEDNGILIIYATIHGNTAKAAHKMGDILKEKTRKSVDIIDLTHADISKTIAESFKYENIIFAASSYNMGVFPCMESLLRQLISKNFQNKKIGIIENGSWAPSAGKVMKEILLQGKDLKIIEPMITIKSAMSDENVEEMKVLAKKLME